MTLIKSISGIRGTIGGQKGQNLTPIDIAECVAGYGQWLQCQHGDMKSGFKVVVGRDGRISGPIVSQIAIQTLLAMGIDVIDLGLSTTPTVEMAVPHHQAHGGIIFTASHNPKEWNALKFLNHKGEFISAADGVSILNAIDRGALYFSEVDQLGTYSTDNDAIDNHIKEILALPYLQLELLRSKKYKVVVDAINSTGAIAIPPLLDQLGCTYHIINKEVTGNFAHNPEPLAEHLTDLCDAVKMHKADIGIAVDPDVDRLCFVTEEGKLFGEEYTLVAIADYILKRKKGATVSNLSSTRALADVTKKYGMTYHAAAVGEVNVVTKMKEVQAVIGGEGNGGVILPDLHYGRDALAGIVLFLMLMAESDSTASDLRASYPDYIMIKDKINLSADINPDDILGRVAKAFGSEKVNTIDGVKIDFAEGWVHIRKSNTEPIIRVYCEGADQSTANDLIQRVKTVALA